MDCKFLRLGNGKGFICSHCGAGYMLYPDNRCWETQQRIDVLDNLENSNA